MFSWVVTLAAEIMSITEVFHFHFKPDYLQKYKYPADRVEWSAGVNTNPAVWVGIFLIVALLVNLLPVRQYGKRPYRIYAHDETITDYTITLKAVSSMCAVLSKLRFLLA